MGAKLWPLLEEDLARPIHWELSLLRQLSPPAECMAGSETKAQARAICASLVGERKKKEQEAS